jgi:hypothetical protein
MTLEGNVFPAKEIGQWGATDLAGCDKPEMSSPDEFVGAYAAKECLAGSSEEPEQEQKDRRKQHPGAE